MYKNIQEHFERLLPSKAKEFTLKPFQVNVIENVLNNGNTLCVMPTGSGKSIIYYLSGLISGGITIVISPLIALICEQEENLKKLGIEVLALHSGISSEKQFSSLLKFAQNKINPKFIFVSPEKLATDGFFEYCIQCRKNEIKLITIDEVHCVSQWGLHFRPFYKDIPGFLYNVFHDKTPNILALTATLNPKELTDITTAFKIKIENILKDTNFMRSEITLKVIKCITEEEKEDKLWNLLKIHKDEKTLVYVYRVKGGRSVEDFSYRANYEHSLKSAFFHGEMSAKERQEIIAKYKSDKINVIFATSAFGMGLDIKDIRVVIHFWIPESIEQYYQEIGRAARDKGAANAYLLFSEKNLSIKKEYFIDKSFPNRGKLSEVFNRIFKPEPGLQTLSYFEDEDTAQCLQYYIEAGIVKIIAKGFGNFNNLSKITNSELQHIYDLTKKKLLITSAKKSNMPVEKIVELVYSSIVNNEAIASKLDKCLVVDVNKSTLSDTDLDAIEQDIELKKEYKHSLLDFFIFTLSNTNNSVELHQEIGRYLGANKESLNKIYPTSKGDYVRSKSEVIIANLLYNSELDYEYEKELKYDFGIIRPDFTVKTPNGNIYYWEHLGMLGKEEYDNTWLFKKNIYDNQFNGKLKVTYEGITINDSATRLINELKKL